jgi:hypothetical protein
VQPKAPDCHKQRKDEQHDSGLDDTCQQAPKNMLFLIVADLMRQHGDQFRDPQILDQGIIQETLFFLPDR